MYQRDRGELDWDQRSIASTNVLMNDTASLHHQKSTFYANSTTSGKPRGYDDYLAHGTTHEIEMSRFDSRGGDQYPLLAEANMQQHGFAGSRAGTPTPPSLGMQSVASLPAYSYGNFNNMSQGSVNAPMYPPGVPQPLYPPQTQPAMYADREASLHRPMPPSRINTQSPAFSQMGNRSTSPGDGGNLAGRGAHRF